MSADPDRLFRGAGLPIWLGVMAVSVIASVVAWVGGQHIETDIRRAFGDGSPQTELDRWLDVQVGAALGETVVLIGHSDRAALRDAVGAARAFIAGSPVLSDEGSAFRLPPGQSLLAHRGYLLSPDDQARLGDVAAAALAAEALRRAYSPTGMASAFGWDADPFGTLGRFATSRWPQVGFEMDGDTPVKRRDGLDWAVLRLRSDARSFGLDGASRTVAALDELAKAVAARSPDARYLDLSISRHTHRAAEQSKREISRIGLVSIVAILFLLTGLFRHPVPFALTVFSVASGMLVGFAAVSVIFGELHLIAMVFGAALIGVAVDYALHLLIADGDGRQRVRAVLPGVSLG
ncbi:hypothetical protein, partial [uncultured Abyssibacter sp.]|uniref:hypothetical protein n=1 Tax=uncultured Abyssibacter sp. TaxID=2320202 RepID=UPI0032B12319